MADDQVNLTEQTNQVHTEPLREASPLPDLEEEEELPQPIVRHVPVRDYQREAIVYLQRFGIQSILFLQVLWSLLNRAASATQTVSTGVLRSLQSQLYVFFQEIPYPYRAQTTMLAGPGIPSVEWYYNADTNTFLSSTVYNTTNAYHTHHLEWLMGEIRYNDLVLYDISEFLQQVRWAGTARPSASLILAAWSIHSGIVLNLREGLVLKTINEDGSESTLQLRG